MNQGAQSNFFETGRTYTTGGKIFSKECESVMMKGEYVNTPIESK